MHSEPDTMSASVSVSTVPSVSVSEPFTLSVRTTHRPPFGKQKMWGTRWLLSGQYSIRFMVTSHTPWPLWAALRSAVRSPAYIKAVRIMPKK